MQIRPRLDPKISKVMWYNIWGQGYKWSLLNMRRASAPDTRGLGVTIADGQCHLWDFARN
jgi:hypothetical protein